MKNFLFSILATLASLSAQAGEGDVKVDCGSGAAHVRLSGNIYRSIEGDLRDGYNGARIACRNFSWENLREGTMTLPCAGIWNVSFDRSGEGNDKVALVTLKKDHATGRISAEYLRDWDGRDRHATGRITLACTVQES